MTFRKRWAFLLLGAAAVLLIAAVYAQSGGGEIGTNDFRISTVGTTGDPWTDGFDPAVAFNQTAGEYLVVWAGEPASSTSGETEIYGQRIRASDGALSGSAFRISDMGSDGDGRLHARQPAVAWNSSANEYLVVWSGDDDTSPLVDDEFEIFGQRLTGGGAPVGANDFRISDMGPDGDVKFAAFDPQVVYNPVANGYVVVWAGDDNSGALVDQEVEIFGQRLTGAGAATGTNDFRISTMGPNGDPAFRGHQPALAVDTNTGNVLVVWAGSSNAGSLVSGEYEIYGIRFNSSGAVLGSGVVRLSSMGPDGNASYQAAHPAAAFNRNANQFLVVWSGSDNSGSLAAGELEIFGQRLTAAGAEIGSDDFRISDMGPDGDPAFDAIHPAILYDSRGPAYLVTWRGDDNTPPNVNDAFEIFGQWLKGSDGSAVGVNDMRLSDMGADGAGSANIADRPAVAAAANRTVLVVWQGDDQTAGMVDNEFEIFGQRLQTIDLTSKVYLPLVIR